MKTFRSRLLSYYKGFQCGREAAYFGQLSEDSKAYLKAARENEQFKKVFDFMTNQSNLPLELYIGVMDSAMKMENSKELLILGQNKDPESVQVLAEGIEAGIRRFSEEERKNQNTTGMDENGWIVGQILEQGQGEKHEQ